MGTYIRYHQDIDAEDRKPSGDQEKYERRIEAKWKQNGTCSVTEMTPAATPPWHGMAVASWPRDWTASWTKAACCPPVLLTGTVAGCTCLYHSFLLKEVSVAQEQVKRDFFALYKYYIWVG